MDNEDYREPDRTEPDVTGPDRTELDRTELDRTELDQTEFDQLDLLAKAFSEQLMACLEECARGRKGLFSDVELLSEGGESWVEAKRLRQLAVALEGVFRQQQRNNLVCDEFLDLCSMNGESHPGEQRLARAFLRRIERGEVGIQPRQEKMPW
jgi:hypothetical protein